MRPGSRQIIIPWLAVALLFSAGLAGSGLGALSTGRNHAVVIGIGQYENWPALASPPVEARALASILFTRYDFRKEDVVLLTDDSETPPTRDRITLLLEKFLEKLSENDNLLVFFSGRSETDGKGETYWIPQDAKSQTTLNWLRHSDLVNEYFGSPKFKVKNLIILTDSPFSPGLLESRPNPLSVMDLRFSERVRQKAGKASREVIASGRSHEDPARAGSMGPFAQRVTRALSENTLEMVDVESLLFAPKGIGARGAPADLGWVRGRVKGQADPSTRGGQFVLLAADLFPTVDVSGATAEPDKGYPGDVFTIRAATAKPAHAVILTLDGQKISMKGEGTTWTHEVTIPDAGTHEYSVEAVNELDRPGKAAGGVIRVASRPAPGIEVERVQASPAEVAPGDEVVITVTTRAPARAVVLTVDGRTVSAQGGGVSWFARVKAGEAGKRKFLARAVNEDQAEGPPKEGFFSVRSSLVSVVKLTRSPASGDVGQTFVIEARTDQDARAVHAKINGREQDMEGSATRWSLRFTPDRAGTFSIAAYAENDAGRKGPEKEIRVTAGSKPEPPVEVKDLPRPEPPPALAERVEISSVRVTPRKVSTKEPCKFIATTNRPAKAVFLELGDQRTPMSQDGGNTWTAGHTFMEPGTFPYAVVAESGDGTLSQRVAGAVLVKAAPVEIVESFLEPDVIYAGGELTVIAITNRPAAGVDVRINEVTFPMQGSGVKWSYTTTVPSDSAETLTIYIRAKNEEGQYGSPKIWDISK